MKTTMDPDTLAAFVDGELSPEDAALVMMHLDAHPEDQAFVDQITRSNQLLAKAFDAPLYEPIPEAILATIRDHVEPEESAGKGNVISFPFGRRLPVPAQAVGGLLAASLAVVVGLSVWQDRGPEQLNVGALASASALSGVLDTVPTGGIAELAEMEAEATVLSSFFDADNRPCREFEVSREDSLERGIACRADAGWTIAGRVTLPEVALEDDGVFVPASGSGSSALDAVLDTLGAGMILSHGEEEELIANGWISD